MSGHFVDLTMKDCRDLKKDFGDDWRSIAEYMRDGESDFCNGSYRFIHMCDIETIMEDELSSDPYILGCFNASFLAGVMGWRTETIEALQKAEAFEDIGNELIEGGYVADLVEDYIAADGAGHHFSSYDGSEVEYNDYSCFRN